MGHLRAVLRHVGKQGLADNPAYSNRSLGIAQGSRKGTKEPLSDAQIRAFQQRAERLGRPDMGAILELQRALGLREVEAIRAGRSDTLLRLHRELTERGYARIIEGPKGGRMRDVRPADVGGRWQLCSERWRYWKRVDESICWLAPRASKPPG
jgi:hypothetical protein